MTMTYYSRFAFSSESNFSYMFVLLVGLPSLGLGCYLEAFINMSCAYFCKYVDCLWWIIIGWFDDLCFIVSTSSPVLLLTVKTPIYCNLIVLGKGHPCV